MNFPDLLQRDSMTSRTREALPAARPTQVRNGAGSMTAIQVEQRALRARLMSRQSELPALTQSMVNRASSTSHGRPSADSARTYISGQPTSTPPQPHGNTTHGSVCPIRASSWKRNLISTKLLALAALLFTGCNAIFQIISGSTRRMLGILRSGTTRPFLVRGRSGQPTPGTISYFNRIGIKLEMSHTIANVSTEPARLSEELAETPHSLSASCPSETSLSTPKSTETTAHPQP
jgi:hypothetical protein